MDLISSSYFSLFLIITIGFLLGKISIKGISLDISAVIFVALVFGHYGVVIPKDFQVMGLVLFLFTIGIQAGPGFFESFKNKGRDLIALAFVLVSTSGIVAFVCGYIYDIDKSIIAGLLTGALTSTPGLAAAIDITKSPLASIGYGVAYPFGVIGVILFVRFLPKIIKADIQEAEDIFQNEIKAQHPEMFGKFFVVQNDHIVGKTLGDLRVRSMTRSVISRVSHQGEVFTPNAKTILCKGDIIKAVGTESSLDRISVLVGPETNQKIPLSKFFEVRSVLVSNTDVVNMTLGELNLYHTYSANITRIRRAGIDIHPSPRTKLLLGDKIVVASNRDNMKQVVNIFGDDSRRLSDTDFLPIAFGIVLGILVGKINLSLGNFSFSPGLSGGVLIVSLILGRVGKTGPMLWTMTGAANNLLRQLGLLLFLAAVGTSAGSLIVETFNEHGASLFIIGALITSIPMIVGTIFAKVFLKMDILTLLGALTGSMTSTPGLAAVDPMTDTSAPSVAYATVYPAAMVFVIIVVQIICNF